MNIIPNHLRACHLQAIIDQNPKDDTARRARELLERLSRHSGQQDDYAIKPAEEVGKGEV